MPDFTARITEILRDNIHQTDLDEFHPAMLPHLATLISAAAKGHYRPRIETVEELDALPEGSVVRDDSRYVYEKATARRWHQPGWEGQRWSDAIDLPATVLWSPGGERSAAETRTLTCDAGCLDEGAPMEECSAHGRTPADLWLQLDLVRKQRDEARPKVETPEQLDAQPVGVVVLDAELNVCERLGGWDDGLGGPCGLMWGTVGVAAPVIPALPAVVLWSPGAGE